MAKLFSTGSISPIGQQVDKATSGLLIAPDWGSNMEICDVLNTDPRQTRDVVKAIRKRLQNKDWRVQMYTLTLLETMMKNCGEHVHHHVAEKDILPEMVKIVKKKSNMQVRERVLELLDTWQEAFGGPSGRYRQYWFAYDELRRAGVSFPPRRADAEPSAAHMVPAVQVPPQPPHQGFPAYGSPVYGSPMSFAQPPSEPQEDPSALSLADLVNARSSVEVLAEMLSAVDPNNRQALQDEVILELVEQCLTNQRRVMGLVNVTGDEELLRQGLALNDELQKVLTKHEALAAGAPGPGEAPRHPQARLARFDHEEPEEEDDFGQLAHRSTARDRLQTPAAPQQVAAPGVGPNHLGPRSVDLLSGEEGGGLTSPPIPQPAAAQPAQPLPPPQQYSPYSAPGQYDSPQQYVPPSSAPMPSYPPVPQQQYSAPPSQQYGFPPAQQPQFPPAAQPQQPPSQAQQSSYGYGEGGGIKPLPAPPGRVSSQRSLPVPSLSQQRVSPPPPLPSRWSPTTPLTKAAMPPQPSMLRPPHPPRIPPSAQPQASLPSTATPPSRSTPTSARPLLPSRSHRPCLWWRTATWHPGPWRRSSR